LRPKGKKCKNLRLRGRGFWSVLEERFQWRVGNDGVADLRERRRLGERRKRPDISGGRAAEKSSETVVGGGGGGGGEILGKNKLKS